MAETFGEAFYKAQEATQTKLSLQGTATVSVDDRDKEEAMEAVRDLIRAGFSILQQGRHMMTAM